MHRGHFLRATALLILLAFTLVERRAWAQTEGPALVDILALPVGARAISMGGAQVALTDGPDAPMWNPAALGFLSSERAVMVSYSRPPWFPDERDMTFAGGAMRVERLGFVAVNIAYLSYPDNPPPGDEYDPYEFLATFAYGVPAGKDFAIGIAIKYIRIEYDVNRLGGFGWNLSGSGAAFDVGLLWHSPEERLRAGINVQNLGPDLSLIDPRPPDDLPRNLKIGVGARVIEGDGGNLTLAFDADEALAGDRDWPRLRFGAEVAFRQLNTAVRAGWIYDGFRKELAEESQASGGFGVGWRGISFDYAASPWGPPWQDTHHFSAGMHF